MEEFCQGLGLNFADRALAVDGFRGPAARSEQMHDVFLLQATRLHQMLQDFVRGRRLDRVTLVFVFLDQRRDQVEQVVFFRRDAVAFLEQLFDLGDGVVILS